MQFFLKEVYHGCFVVGSRCLGSFRSLAAPRDVRRREVYKDDFEETVGGVSEKFSSRTFHEIKVDVSYCLEYDENKPAPVLYRDGILFRETWIQFLSLVWIQNPQHLLHLNLRHPFF